ncbi:MAG: hypothetical protein ACI4RN_04370, partial [Oscillospiraceae bacterium]
YKKGFLKSIVSLLGIVIIFIGSYYSAQIFSPIIYEKLIQTKLENHIENKIQDTSISNMISKQLKKYDSSVDISDNELQSLLKTNSDLSDAITDKISDSDSLTDKKLKTDLNNYFSNDFVKQISKNVLDLDLTIFDLSKLEEELDYNINMSYDIVRAMANGDNKLASQYIAANFVVPIVLLALDSLVFLISFVLLSILLKIILKVSGVLDVIPILSGVNKFLGLFVGIAKSCIYLVIFALLVNVVIHSSLNSHINITDTDINKTYIFNAIYTIVCK